MVLGLTIIYTIYSLAGPQWDLMVRSLLGKTILNFATSNINPRAAFIGEFQNNLLFYYEPYREPVSLLVFALLSVFFKSTILPYLVLTFLLYSITVYALSRCIGVDKLVAFTAFLNGYFIYFLFLPNGGEVFAVIFVIIGVIYLLKKSYVSGLFFAIATLSKYPAIAFLPIVLLLWDRKKVLKALALEAIVLLIFMAFDYYMYGNPVYSFTESIANSNTLSTSSSIDISALALVLVYPAIVAGIGTVALALKKQGLRLNLDFRTKVFACMILLSVVEAIVIIPHNDPETQARYGFLVMLSLLIPATIILDSAVRKVRNLRYAIAALAIVLLIFVAISSYMTGNTKTTMYYNPDNPNSIYAHAGAELTALGYGNCRFITNTWPAMLYIGYDAYSPFSIYQSPTITPVVESIAAQEGINYTSYQKEGLSEPILVFKYNGVNKSSILNINQAKLVYNDSNISIYLPDNASCYTD